MRNLAISICICVIIVFQNGLAEKCEDRANFCRYTKQYCLTNPTIRELCPKSCVQCSDGCAVNNGGCSHYCTEVDDGTSCSCEDGFQLDQDLEICIDINECDSHICENDQKCVNTIGSYSCQSQNCQNLGLHEVINKYKSDSCCFNQVADDNEQYPIQDVNEKLSPWPWMAQILRGGSHLCGATLLTDKWLVTSATCLRRENIEYLEVFVGHVRSAHFNFPMTSRARQSGFIEKVVFRDDASNIALIKMVEPFSLNGFVKTLSLPQSDIVNEGDTCWVTGFGLTSENGELSPKLKKIDLPISSSDDCVDYYSQVGRIVNTTTTLCAGFKSGGKDACFGDGGGPLMCQRTTSCSWYLAGIVSSGLGCGRPNFPGLYTRVTAFEDWINQVLSI